MSTDFRLKVFCSVAKNLSFTKASQELFVSQPAISKHIQELENLYRVRLFERMGNRILLTDAGKLLLAHSEKIVEGYARLEYDMGLLRNEHRGELRLGASTTIAHYVLPPLLAGFIERYPQVSLTLLSGNSAEVEKALQEHRIDLAFVEGNVKQPSLKYTTFLEDELVAIVPSHSKWANREEIELEELKEIPLVLREYGSGTLDIILAALQRHHIKLSDLQIRLQLGSTESIKLFLEKSDCMSIVSIRSISKELYEGKFKLIELKGLSMHRLFDVVQLHGQEEPISSLFTQYADRYKQKL
ncbi:MAG: LysR substrate-binding domain-containing protein [Phocaeicola sp.]